MKVASARALALRLERVEKVGPRSAVDEFLQAKIPIHFGGMSDPFTPLESTRRRTLDLIRILAEHRYPTLISTKGVLAAETEYVRYLQSPNFVVQFSISFLRDEESLAIDAGAPASSERLKALKFLSDAGVKTAVRIQPLFPNHVGQAAELISRCAESGARHLAVEFLKVPIEQRWDHRDRLSGVLGLDLVAYYRERGARRVGREWILPVDDRLPVVVELGAVTRSLGMTFGAGDTDLLHLSHGSVCCSGADLLGLGPGYRHNFLTAVRSGFRDGRVAMGSIEKEWRPVRSVAQHLNSNSRRSGGSIEDYIRARWNGVANGPSPLAFHGVKPTEECDDRGYRVYELSSEVRELKRRL